MKDVRALTCGAGSGVVQSVGLFEGFRVRCVFCFRVVGVPCQIKEEQGLIFFIFFNGHWIFLHFPFQLAAR